ncbi:MAG: cation:proton antiporter [Acholeplasmatales bacterium]|jgi:Kef-type K+ transport system membrane component KefB|nr:cation:proton antiporter [Acholeplasmatales bacterium]
MFLEVAKGIEAFEVLLPLALILFLSKLLSIGCKKIGLPQVVGMLLTGIVLGFITLIPNQPIFNSTAMEGINFIAEIGVILIMFSAGIETDLKQIKATGVSALVITLLGVLVPILFGFGVAGILPGGFGKEYLIRNIFYGVILTATSVSVTVATLKELGKLNSKIGTAIVSAAILDDILGVIVLSVVISLNQALTSASSNLTIDILIVFGKTIGFFIFAIVLGIAFRYIFKMLSQKYGHHRRLPIFGIAIAFFFSYAAEEWFRIADITGAFFAGLMLSGGKDSEYIERRTDIASYMLFTPVFFAKVGLTSLSSFSQIDSTFIIFGFLFIIAGILGKILGCGVGAKLTKNSWKDSYRCGLGMMCRAEVCLICANKGISAGIISASIQPFILCLILITSFVTPVLLKQSYKNEIPQEILTDIVSKNEKDSATI